MPRNTGARTPVTVTLGFDDGSGTITTVKYAFLSGLKDSLRDNFGQTVITASLADVNQLIFKANNVKPPKAQKFISVNDGYEGSFCGASKVASLKQNGYSITRSKFSIPALSGVAKSKLYYGTVNGLKIGYRVNDTTLPPNFADVTGLKLATSNDVVIMGCSFPKLGQAKYTDPNTGKVSTYACDPGSYDNISQQTNWSAGRAPLASKDSFLKLIGLA